MPKPPRKKTTTPANKPVNKAATPKKQPADPLLRLPRRAEAVIIGGRRTLQTTLEDDEGQAIQPQIVLWVDQGSQYVLNSGITALNRSPDDGVTEATEMLIASFADPGGALNAEMPLPAIPAMKRLKGLPGKVIVADPALAAQVSARLAPYQITVENVDELPQIDEMLSDMLESLGFSADGAPPPPFAWDLPQAAAVALYAAAGQVWQQAPWEYLAEYPTVAITLDAHGPAPEVPTLYAAILGGGGEVLGIACYYSNTAYEQMLTQSMALNQNRDELRRQAIEQMRAAGLPMDLLSPEMLEGVVDQALAENPDFGGDRLAQDALVCFFDARDELDQTYLAWLDERKIKPPKDGVPTFLRTSPEAEPRQPDVREARAFTLALAALAQFCAQFKATLLDDPVIDEPLTMTAQVDKEAVPISYVPADANALIALTLPPEARTTVYRLHVALDWVPDVWRRIEIRGDQTLDDLHLAIQDAFGWANDHMYAFFLSNKPWDAKTEYQGNPLGEGNAGVTAIYTLELHARKQFLYIFDFGDDLRHRIKVEAVVKNGVADDAEYPRVSESHGTAPPQYPNAEDDEDDIIDADTNDAEE